MDGPVDGNTQTAFSTDIYHGSTYESSEDNVSHWWEVDLRGTFAIAQVKIFACAGEICHPQGKKLDRIKIDIFNGPVTVFSASYFLDQGPIFDLILSSEVPGQIVRITKTVPGEVLSLSEVQILGH